jgi:hypothetical protein
MKGNRITYMYLIIFLFFNDIYLRVRVRVG